MNRLPKLPQASNLLGEPTAFHDGRDSYKKWLVPQLDIYGSLADARGGFGEFHRGTYLMLYKLHMEHNRLKPY